MFSLLQYRTVRLRLMCVFFSSFFCRLNIIFVVFRIYVLLTYFTTNKTAIMFMGLFISSFHHLVTVLTLVWLLCRPACYLTVLRITQLARISAYMVFVITFPTHQSILLASKKCWHTCYYIIISIVRTQVNMPSRIRARIKN